MLPFVSRHPLREERVPSWERAWEQAGNESFVLESGKGGRYSFLGLKPTEMIRSKNSASPPPLEQIKKWMQPFKSPRVDGAPKFIGGCVGFLSYDIVRTLERIPNIAADDLALPEFIMMRYDHVWIMDHEEQTLYCAVHTFNLPKDNCAIHESGLNELYRTAKEQSEAMKRQWDDIVYGGDLAFAHERKQKYHQACAGKSLQIDVESIPDVERAFAKQAYMSAVDKIKDYIRQGDVFQVNLSVRQSKRLVNHLNQTISSEEIYEWLRLINPSPYMALLRFADFQLVSVSPELLVLLEDGTIRTRPIAGTRPRGINDAEDRQLANELILNEKERAEHVMLIDLQRNDLGKVAKYGTVKVDDFMAVEIYSHVMHIVSQVSGQLINDKNAYDVLAAVFPGGTITGAPKVRTMEIIEQLEPVRRGPYTGSIGWIDYNGNMEFNIVIRTIVVHDKTAYIQAGAGIVIDSEPELEYAESINKAKALWQALQFCER